MDSSGAQARYIGTRMSNFQILLRQETIEGLVVKNWNLNRADTVLLFHFWFGFGRFFTENRGFGCFPVSVFT